MEDNATIQHERAVKNLISTQVLFDGTDVKLCDFGLTTPCRRDASGARELVDVARAAVANEDVDIAQPYDAY